MITELRLTQEQRQRLLQGIAIATFVGALTTYISTSVPSGAVNVGDIAVIADLSWFLYVYNFMAYSSACARYGPDGIAIRSLARRYELRWEQINDISVRTRTRRDPAAVRSIIVTTADGDHIRLPAPASIGFANDPALLTKYRNLRASWQAATGSTRPEQPYRARPHKIVLALLGLAVIGQAVAAMGIAGATQSYEPELRAGAGMGTPGTFTPEVTTCQDGPCVWFGEFVASGTETQKQVLLDTNRRDILPNVAIPAYDTGDPYAVYTADSTAWEYPVGVISEDGGIFLAVLAAEIGVPWLRYRRRRKRTRAGLSRYGGPLGY